MNAVVGARVGSQEVAARDSAKDLNATFGALLDRAAPAGGEGTAPRADQMRAQASPLVAEAGIYDARAVESGCPGSVSSSEMKLK